VLLSGTSWWKLLDPKLALVSHCLAAFAFFAAGPRSFSARFARDVDLDCHGFTQPDFLSKGPRSDAERRKMGFPSRKRFAWVS
jgi:hypothetical protein